jgi:hypothetical protein
MQRKREKDGKSSKRRKLSEADYKMMPMAIKLIWEVLGYGLGINHS